MEKESDIIDEYSNPHQPGAYFGLCNSARERNFSITGEFLKRYDPTPYVSLIGKRYKRENVVLGGIV